MTQNRSSLRSRAQRAEVEILRKPAVSDKRCYVYITDSASDADFASARGAAEDVLELAFRAPWPAETPITLLVLVKHHGHSIADLGRIRTRIPGPDLQALLWDA